MASTQFFKEYSCYELEPFLSHLYAPFHTVTLFFNGHPLLSHATLPASIIDSQADQDRLYILRWTSKSQSQAHVDILEYPQQHGKRIVFNRRPSLIAIVQGYIYIVGGRDLYVVQLDSMKLVRQCGIGNAELFALEPVYLPHSKDRGVVLYSWNIQDGHCRRFFSCDGVADSGTSWWSSAIRLLKKADPSQYGVVKPIIPNVIGLLFLNPSPNRQEIRLINLTEMSPIKNTSIQSPGQPLTDIKVKYYSLRNINTNYDSSLLIGVSQGSRIMILRLDVRYREVEKELLKLEIPGLESFTNGRIVDWASVRLEEYLVYEVSGRVIDLVVKQEGFLFYAEDESKIPYANFINLGANEESHHSILSLEHNIYRSYLQDSLIPNTPNNEQALFNSLLKPNRYSLPFLLYCMNVRSINEVKPSATKPLSILMQWHRMYKVKSIIEFNQNILIVRETSLTTLLPIPKEQFLIENQSRQEVLQHFRQPDLASDSGSRFSNGPAARHDENLRRESEKLKDVLEGEGGVAYEEASREGMDQEGEKGSATKVFQKYFSELYLRVARVGASVEKNEDMFVSSSQTQSSPLICLLQNLFLNRLKDRIQFYSRILLSCEQVDSGLNIPTAEKILTLHLLHFLSESVTKCARFSNIFSTDLITMLVNKYFRYRFTNDFYKIDKQVDHCIARIVEGLIREGDGVNVLIRMLINTSLAESEIIGSLLLQIFHKRVFHMLPYSYSVLLALCFIPIPFAEKSRYIHSFALHHIGLNRPVPKVLSVISTLSKDFPFLKHFHETIKSSFGHYPQLEAHQNSHSHSHPEDPRDIGICTLSDDLWKSIRHRDVSENEEELFNMKDNEVDDIMESLWDSESIRRVRFEDLLVMWALLYRYHMKRFGTAQSKAEAVEMLRGARKCLPNAAEYYCKVYGCEVESEEFLIEEVCGRMMDVEPVLLFQNMVPKRDLMELLQSFLLSPQTTIESIWEFKNVAFFHLAQSLQSVSEEKVENSEMEQTMRKLNKLVSKKEISEMILESEDLNSMYQNCLPTQIRAFLNYSNVNTVSFDVGASLNFQNAYIESLLQK